jgi:hypothetical protein
MNAEPLVDFRVIQRRVKALAGSLGKSDYTIRSGSPEDGSPHVEVSDAYYFVVRERGVELSRRRTSDLDELLYWILEGLASSIAWDFELRHRREGKDPRRQGFAKQVELLATLSPDWAERKRAEQAEILKRHPFRDG